MADGRSGPGTGAVRRRRVLGVVAVAVLAVVAPAARPAAAFDDGTASTSGRALTWVDGQGRQYVMYTRAELAPEDPFTVQRSYVAIARTTPDGAPDASWSDGPGPVGVREVPELSGAVARAVSDGGTITLVTSVACPGETPSGRCTAFERRHADGSVAAPTVTVPVADLGAASTPDLVGGDGSVLLSDGYGAGHPVSWWGADGVDRGLVRETGDGLHLTDATVDSAGSLLLASDDGIVTRQAPGGAVDRTVATPCRSGQTAIAADGAGGFAVACPSATDEVTVVRYAVDGSVIWSFTGVDAEAPFTGVHEIAVDGTGRVWVGGPTPFCSGTYWCGVRAQAKAFDAGGSGPQAWHREDSNFVRAQSGTVTDLRRTPDGDVAIAYVEKCCFINTTGWQVLGDSVSADVLPLRPSVTAAVDRLYQELVGRLPTADERPAAESQAATAAGRAALAASLLDSGRAHASVEPVARLYRAVFLRDPDPSGLAYWVRKREGGMLLGDIAKRFTGSPEFQRRYQGTSNRGFVEAVYRNVFGREGDPPGIAYWTKRLDLRRSSRAQVVLQFSESSEGIRLAGPVVEPLATSWLLLGRVPTPAERASWAASADPHHDVAAEILAGQEYRDRASG